MALLKTYEETAILRTCNCDFLGKWRPSAIFESMQEVSGMHSHLLGCGRERLIEKNLVWVLSRIEVQMECYPEMGERVTIKTFPMPNKRWFFPRYFVFEDEKGAMLGRAASLWLLLDIITRKMAAPGEVAELLPDNSDLIAPMQLPATVTEVQGEEMLFQHTPVYTDLDVNGHVNNTKYVDWLCDALGIETMGQKCLQSICINYDAEVRPHQEISLHLKQNGSEYSLSGIHEDKRHFEISGCLINR